MSRIRILCLSSTFPSLVLSALSPVLCLGIADPFVIHPTSRHLPAFAGASNMAEDSQRLNHCLVELLKPQQNQQAMAMGDKDRQLPMPAASITAQSAPWRRVACPAKGFPACRIRPLILQSPPRSDDILPPSAPFTMPVYLTEHVELQGLRDDDVPDGLVFFRKP